MIKRTFKKEGSKSGIALIVTLGFLAVLILMAVAFSVSMRVERQAAKNFADVIQARQWTYSALAYAMSETEKHIGTGVMLPDANHVYPSSGGGDVVANPTLYSGSATNYVPGSLQFAAANTTVNWTPVKDDTPAQKVVAQYAYEVIDCSGLIDANMGSLVNQTLPGYRGTATNAFDLWLDNAILPELAVGAESDLKRGYDKPLKYAPDPKRVAPWYEFSSFADFWQTLRTGPYCAGVLAAYPQNFFIYSRFPKGYLNSAGAVDQPMTLDNSQASWDTPGGLRGLLGAEITKMGGVNEPDALACQIIDYCDADHRPTGQLTTFDTETTPLVNEFSIDFKVDPPLGTNLVMHMQPHVEVWYPFINSTNTLSYTLKFQLLFPGSLSVYNMNIGIGAVPNATLSPAGGKWIYNTYYAPPPGAASPAGIPEIVVTNGPLGFAGQKVLVSAAVIEGTQNQQVDSVVRLQLKLDDVKTTPGTTKIGMACDDPRFNAYASDWTYTGGSAAVLPTINSGSYLNGFNLGVANKNGGDFLAGDQNIWIYMPDQKLRSSGELGLIACDPTKPWTTIDLLSGPGFLPILDHFTILTNKLRRGLVNINSWNSNVLATAFNQAPGARYPGESAASTCTVAMAKALGATLASKAPYKNVSEISGMGVIAGLDRMQTEGVIRNTADILSVRQNVFTILVAAQTGSDINNNQKLDPDEVSGEQHAIAVVWRDPYPNAQGIHESFVRYFRWLTD